jgi:hypothetical protein
MCTVPAAPPAAPLMAGPAVVPLCTHRYNPQGSSAAGEILDLSVRTVPGGHLRPMQQAIVDLPPDVARLANEAVYASGDAIGGYGPCTCGCCIDMRLRGCCTVLSGTDVTLSTMPVPLSMLHLPWPSTCLLNTCASCSSHALQGAWQQQLTRWACLVL